MTPSRRNNINNQNVIKEIKSVQNASYSRQEPVKNAYMEPKPIKIEKEQKPKFKASPVISPVYGILDKNYTKEEVKEKKEDKRDIKRSSKKVDFETVRKKAFGNLVDDIKDNLMCENCELYKEVKKISSLKEDDLLYDLTLDTPKEELTIEKCYDNYEDFGVSYEKEEVKITKEDIKNIVGSDEKEVNITDAGNSEGTSKKLRFKTKYARIGFVSFVVIASSIVFYFCLFENRTLFGFLKSILSFVKPFIAGAAFATLIPITRPLFRSCNIFLLPAKLTVMFGPTFVFVPSAFVLSPFS